MWFSLKELKKIYKEMGIIPGSEEAYKKIGLIKEKFE